MTEPIYIPTNSIGSLFSTPSLAFLNSRLFNDGHLTAVRWCLTLVLIFIFLIICEVTHLFMCLLAEMSTQFFCPVFDWVLLLLLNCNLIYMFKIGDTSVVIWDWEKRCYMEIVRGSGTFRFRTWGSTTSRSGQMVPEQECQWEGLE